MKLLLVRGLPGSGKSTLAKNLIGWYWHLETDQFWMKDGVYTFELERLKEAHQWCLDRAERLMMDGFSPVVSNTFTTKRELRPYFELAKKFDIVPTVILCQNNFGSIHDVPQTTLDAMSERFEYDLTELFNE
jgi:predicted kinase